MERVLEEAKWFGDPGATMAQVEGPTMRFFLRIY